MAKKQFTQIFDDLDGSPEAETVKFGLHGADYEIDLSPSNQRKLEEMLEPYVSKASKVSSSSASRRTVAPRATSESSYDAKAVRVWAASNGITVPPRGRIPGTVIAQYQAADH